MPIKIDVRSIESPDFRVAYIADRKVIEIYAANLELKQQLEQSLAESGILFFPEMGTYQVFITNSHACSAEVLKDTIVSSLRDSGYQVEEEFIESRVAARPKMFQSFREDC